MSAKGGQGQSDVTEWKVRGISAACAVSLRIFHHKWGARYRYLHFDLHAGCGINEQVGCIGSPLAFLGQARVDGVNNYGAHFCEIDDGRVRQLLAQPQVSGDSRVAVHHGDNRFLLPAIPRIIRDYYHENPAVAQGTVLADPNNHNMPIDELAELARECPRLDLIINWPACAAKRAGRKTALNDLLSRLGRKHWLIRELVGPWEFTLLVGRNFYTGDHKTLGFYQLSSLKGQHILATAITTKDDRKGQSGQLDAFEN